MVLLFYLLAQAQQPQRLPWGFLVLFGFMAVVAVGLLIYFMTRVRRTEKEAEDDWGLSGRGILLTPTTAAAPIAKKKPEAPLEEVPTVKKPEAPVIAAPEPLKPQLAVERPAAPEPEMSAERPAPAAVPVPAEIIPPMPEQPLAELHQEAVAEPGAKPHSEPEHAERAASPFDEDIWSQLEAPRPSAVLPETPSVRPASAVTAHRESYEPPRVDPILPRKDEAKRVDLPAPEIRLPASASERPPADRARLEARPRVMTSAKAAAGSVLGLPAEASAGPFIIDRSRARADAAEVGTLANYDKLPDDKAGHSGTIALIVVIVLVCGSLAAYLALPPVHSRIDNWVAHVRGIDTSEPPKVVQIFPAPYDNTKDPILVKGSLQNISDQSLYGLVVTVSLQPRPGGDQVTEHAQVSPDELPPSQQGTYEFQIDGKKYVGYKIVALKNKDGVQLGYNKPNQQQ